MASSGLRQPLSPQYPRPHHTLSLVGTTHAGSVRADCRVESFDSASAGNNPVAAREVSQFSPTESFHHQKGSAMTLPDVTANLDAAAKRVKELSDQVAAQAKKNGLEWLESYEKVLKNMLDLEEQGAKQSGVDWAATLATTHANFVRETSEIFFSAMSKQLRS